MRVHGMGLLLLLPALLGCGSSQVKVSGRVMNKGEPLPGGMVTFRPENPKFNSLSVPIDESGHFEASLPPGDVQVSVDNRELMPRRSVGPKLPSELMGDARKTLARDPAEIAKAKGTTNADARIAGKYVPINDKYYRVDTSELQYKIDPSNPTLEIDLK